MSKRRIMITYLIVLLLCIILILIKKDESIYIQGFMSKNIIQMKVPSELINKYQIGDTLKFKVNDHWYPAKIKFIEKELKIEYVVQANYQLVTYHYDSEYANYPIIVCLETKKENWLSYLIKQLY